MRWKDDVFCERLGGWFRVTWEFVIWTYGFVMLAYAH